MRQFKRTWSLLLGLACLSPVVAEFDEKILIRNRQYGQGYNRALTAKDQIEVKDVKIKEGAELNLFAGNEIVLDDGFEVEGDFSAEIVDVTPEVILAYPENNALVDNAQKDLRITIIFQGALDLSGIKVKDQTGLDLTHATEVTPSGLRIHAQHLTSGSNTFSIYDGDTLLETRTVVVDAEAPVTLASHQSGHYQSSSPIEVSLSLQNLEDATLYYSTNGYPPIVGSSHTTAVEINESNPSVNVGSFSSTTKLMYYAIDKASNKEVLKSQIYRFDAKLAAPMGFTVTPQSQSGGYQLSWTNTGAKYRLYRASNVFDYKLLKSASDAGYAPPEALRVTELENAGTYPDGAWPGIQFWYAMTQVDSNGVESPSTSLIAPAMLSYEFNPDRVISVKRGVAYLMANVNESGYWEDKRRKRMIANSQALDAFMAASKLEGVELDLKQEAVLRPLYYMVGMDSDNNNYLLGRKLLTMAEYGLDVHHYAAQVYYESYLNPNGSDLWGWGVNVYFFRHAHEQALLKKLGEKTREFSGEFNIALNQDKSWDLTHDDFHKWTHNFEHGSEQASLYVTALVRNANMTDKKSDAELAALQLTNGSFNNSLSETAAMLKWVDLDETQRSNAQAYLMSQQQSDGGWKSNIYVSALCVEALAK